MNLKLENSYVNELHDKIEMKKKDKRLKCYLKLSKELKV